MAHYTHQATQPQLTQQTPPSASSARHTRTHTHSHFLRGTTRCSHCVRNVCVRYCILRVVRDVGVQGSKTNNCRTLAAPSASGQINAEITYQPQ